jgi:RNA polymerase sigma factor (sigma-70 family)
MPRRTLCRRFTCALTLQRPERVQCHKAYLFRAAASVAHDYRRRLASRPSQVSWDDVPPELQPVRLEPNSPHAAADLSERLEALSACLRQLKPKVRAAVVWHLRDGYTCDEISERLSVVTHRVKKYLVKGIAHCRGIAVARDGLALYDDVVHRR